jgi:hypothetical protein
MDDEDFAERQPQVLLLHCYYLNMTIVSRCVPFRDEALFDGYGPNFQHLFNKASRLLLVQDAPAALAPVLFFIATRCRDPALRRTAASYLCQCSWEGIRLSTIADQIIKLEQRGIAHIVTCSGDVPQERRVVVTDVSFSDDSVCTLHLIRPSRCNPSETLYYSFKWVDVHDDAAVTSSITQVSRSLMILLSIVQLLANADDVIAATENSEIRTPVPQLVTRLCGIRCPLLGLATFGKKPAKSTMAKNHNPAL